MIIVHPETLVWKKCSSIGLQLCGRQRLAFYYCLIYLLGDPIKILSRAERFDERDESFSLNITGNAHDQGGTGFTLCAVLRTHG